MTDINWLWTLLAVTLLLDLIASATKSAFTHVSLPYLQSMRDKNERKVDTTIALLEKQGMRTALRLALVFAHFLVAGVVVLIVRHYLPELQVVYLLAILVGVMLLISVIEFFLEKLVLQDTRRAAMRWSGAAALIDFFFMPASKLMMDILGDKAEHVTLLVTDEALRNWVEVDQPESTLEKGEREMIYSIFRFSDTLAKDIMVPRMDVLAMDINTTISDARQEFIKAGHSRVPVYDDTIDNVVGLLYAKDLLSVIDGNDTIASQRSLLRQAYFVPEAKKIDELLPEMRRQGIHMALVVDEYGGVAGLVTLEDIVEEIVGEIRDEYDQGEEQICQQISENEYMFLGRATINEVNETTRTHLSDENADTLGGFIYGELGHVPQPGEVVVADGVEFTVEEVVARRILKVRARMLPTGDSVTEHEVESVI